ncbi:MAG: GAF domain-containing protein [Anaerolineae bacterium]
MIQQLQASRQQLAQSSTEPPQAKLTVDDEYKFFKTLHNVSTALHTFLSEQELSEWFLANIEPIVPYDAADIMVVEANAVHVIGYRSHPEYSQSSLLNRRFILTNLPVLGHVFKTEEALAISDPHTWPGWDDMPQSSWGRSFVSSPILLQDKIIGFVNLTSAQANFYKTWHAQRLQVFADYLGITINGIHHAAIATENARLSKETQRQAQQMAALTELSHEMTEPLDVKSLCASVVRCLQSKLGWPHVAIFTVDTAANELVLQANADNYNHLPSLTNYRQSLYAGIVGRVARTSETVHANNVSHFPEFFQLEGMDIRSELATPLKIGDQVLGVLTVGSNQLNTFDVADVAMLKIVADQAAAALEKIRFFEETHRRAEQLDALSQVLQDLTVLRDSDTLLHQIAERAIQLLDADGCGIYLYRSEPKVLEAVVEILAPGETPLYRDTQSQVNHTLPLTAFDVSAVSVPIQAGTEPLGMLNVNADNRRRRFTQEDKDLLSQFASQAAIAIQNARLYTQIQHHAAQLETRVAERTFELQVLYELTQALGKTTQLSEVVRLILVHLYQAIPHDIAASLLVTNTNTTLVIQSQRPLAPQIEALIQEKMYEDLKQSPDNKPLNIHRIQSKNDVITRPPIEKLASLLQVPITVNETVIGLLLVATEQPNRFNEEQTQLLRTVADQAAEAIQRLQSLLAAEYQRLESLVAHLPNGVILLDSERHIILANPAVRQYLTSLNPTLNGDKLTHLAHHSIETILAASVSPSKGENSYVVEITGPPRQIYSIRAELIAVGPEAGGWLLVIWNDTEARLAQDRIKQQERLAAVGQLAAGIAHDFNNILTSMIGFAELVRMRPDLSPLVKEDLQRIISQGQRAAGLVRQILDFSRQSITEKRPIDILPFLKETIKLLERTIPENIRIILEIEPKPNTYILNADPTQLQQVLTNLAVNARDAMLAGGILRFNLSATTLTSDERPPYPEMSPGNWIVLSISDNGFGIASEVLPHIFEPFFTTKEVGKGTGLGLAQAHGIITQHGGYIDVETEVGVGTTFTLYLPAILSSAKNSVTTSKLETDYGHGELILLVEDDPDVLEVTQAMLVSLGYRVITATNGRHAQEIFDQYDSEIALVLTDVTMPEMGGIALSQALRAKEPQVKIIALTGYPLETESKDLLSQGIVDWLQKPLNRHELAKTLKQSLSLEAKKAS